MLLKFGQKLRDPSSEYPAGENRERPRLFEPALLTLGMPLMPN